MKTDKIMKDSITEICCADQVISNVTILVDDKSCIYKLGHTVKYWVHLICIHLKVVLSILKDAAVVTLF